jgi:monoamine oxidase
MDLSELLKSELWAAIGAGQGYEFQTTLFQPVGGMGRIGALGTCLLYTSPSSAI